MAWTDPKTWTPGEVVTAAMLNTHLRDNLNVIGERAHVRKPSDEGVTSSTVLQNDDHLLFAVGTSQVWIVTVCLFFTCDVAGDLKVAWAVPAGTTGHIASLARPSAGATAEISASDPGDAVTIAFNAHGTNSTSSESIITYSTIVTGGTAGNVNLQWAQLTSSGTATTVRTDSFLIAERVS